MKRAVNINYLLSRSERAIFVTYVYIWSVKFLGNITQNRYTLLKMTKIQNMEKLEKNSKKNFYNIP